MNDFADRVALVTGASGGIGRAIARELLGRGATVVGTAHQHPEPLGPLSATFGVRFRAVALDLADLEAAARLVDETAERHGRLDVLVCAHGAIRDGLLLSAEPADFAELLTINYRSVVACARAVVRPMMRQKYGRIVAVSSVAAHLPGRGQSNYAGTKGALEAFCRALAVELGPKQITVNAVAPGVIETAMTGEIRALAEPEILGRTALGRIGQAEEVAHAVAFLASERAGFITGQTLRVDGGFKLR